MKKTIKILSVTPVMKKDGTIVQDKHKNTKYEIKAVGIVEPLITFSGKFTSLVNQEVEVEITKKVSEWEGTTFTDYMVKLPYDGPSKFATDSSSSAPAQRNYQKEEHFETMFISYAKDLHIAEVTRGLAVNLDTIDEYAHFFLSLYQKLKNVKPVNQPDEATPPTQTSLLDQADEVPLAVLEAQAANQPPAKEDVEKDLESLSGLDF